ncbi:anillin, actin binding protein 2 [Lampris incognitus]|uniref:anillin, actin binding protein 2 n=1 Tax=Lampris incognitus TaxID=2546036 RepID=UPI0024B58292|nr:anillin, actin binding protein 2 [Lampris incognitus]
MESGECNGGELTLKRQRAPLSDSEDNVLSSSGMNYGQKRQRLERAGLENCSPKPLSYGRLAKQEVKPDTPVIQSVRSRVQQLAQKRDGGPVFTQKCLSDPGTDTASVIIPDKSLREHLLGEGEFNQRLERFSAPVFEDSATSSPTGSCPRPRSNFVSDIQQKLQESVTPSSKQASRIRQEREQELRLLHCQPISENAWLKRRSSDSSLVEQVDAEIKDGSFSEALVSSVQKTPVKTTGDKLPCDHPAHASSLELESCDEWQMEWKEPDASKRTGEGEEKEQEAFVKKFQQELGADQPEDQSALELPLDEEQSMFKVRFSENFTTRKALGASVLIEKGMSACLPADENECDSYGDEGIEPSTDEELRVWRYPPDMESREVESTLAGEEQGGTLYTGKNKLEASTFEEKGTVSDVSDHSKQSDIQIGECLRDNINDEVSMFLGTFEQKEDMDLTPKKKLIVSDISSSVYSVKHQRALVQYVEPTICREQGEVEPHKTDKGQTECADLQAMNQDEDTELCTTEEVKVDNETQTGDIKHEEIDLEAEVTVPQSTWQQTGQSHEADVAHVLTKTLTGENVADLAQPMLEAQASQLAHPAETDRGKLAQTLKEAQTSEGHQMAEKMELDAVGRGQGDRDKLTYESQVEEVHHTKRGRGGLKKVTFILEPELIDDSTLSEVNTSFEPKGEASLSETELSSHDETNTAEMIDRMFEEVLEYAGKIEGKRDGEDTEDRDSSIGTCSGDKDKMDTESEKERSGEEEEAKEEVGHGEDTQPDTTGDELLTFPPSGILSPLSKSVEAVVTPLRLAASQLSTPTSLLLTPEELTAIPPADSAPLYSIDAYRTQRRIKLPTIQTVTPVIQRQAPEKSKPQPSINTKDRIAALNEEAGKLQTVINQTLQALSCCTDEEHGRGSYEEAEAEKLLLVSCEKRSALLAELARLKAEGGSNSQKAKGDGDYVTQHPCRGTVSISNVQLPLKVEFVCSSRARTGRPSHYFFVLIRYGPYNIVATPLATATDAQNGDTISFPTTVTLQDIRSNFEIDVEVYSLSQASGNTCGGERLSTKPRVTPRKLLNTITQRSNNSMTSAGLPALNMHRSSNFSLVGSHKITLASLGQSKFPLDKMKFEGKIRRLLGDEFQEKVPFLSPLEGNIYMRLESESHSGVQHQGFLTMFEVVNGFGIWHRRYFVLEGYHMYFWNHPNDKEIKAAEGGISLSSSPSGSVKPVKRDSCARPLTFELVSNINTRQQEDRQDAVAKCWFSADTKQEWSDWMDKLNQVLLDFQTWRRSPSARAVIQEAKGSSGNNIRESVL